MSFVLVTGGVRSGKSKWAERLADPERRVLYVATGAVSDGEMAQRIRLHQERRPAHWGLLEVLGNGSTAETKGGLETHSVGNTTDNGICSSMSHATGVVYSGRTHRLAEQIIREADCWDGILLDCLSTWVSSVLISLPDSEWRSSHTRQQLLSEAERLARFLQESETQAVVVTSETGLGGVAMSPLGRAFQDLLGEVNQVFAERAEDVYLIVSGRPLRLPKEL